MMAFATNSDDFRKSTSHTMAELLQGTSGAGKAVLRKRIWGSVQDFNAGEEREENIPHLYRHSKFCYDESVNGKYMVRPRRAS